MNPEIRAAIASAICSTGMLPHLMTGFLVQWLRRHFADPKNREQSDLLNKIWKAVGTETTIDVESATRWKPETTELRPAVVVARNDWNVLRFGINDQMMGGDWEATGAEYFAAYVEGTHTLFCVSPLPVEAEILAAEVYRETLQFGPAVRRELDVAVKRFATVGVGKIFEIEEARQAYAVPVTVAYGLEERWKLVPYAPFLKKITLSMFLP